MTPFTPAEDAQLRALYTTTPARQLAELMGKTYRQVLNRANKIGVNKREHTHCTRDALLAAGVAGYANREIIGLSAHKVSVQSSSLVSKGLLFAGRRGRRNIRYFTDPAMAQAWSDAEPVKVVTPKAPKPAAWGVKVSHKARVGWGPDDPIHITSNTKITIAPKPPAVLYRTNTYGMAG